MPQTVGMRLRARPSAGAVVAGGLTVVLLLAACSGGSKDDETPTSSPSPTTPTVSTPTQTSPSPTRRVWPLTGLPLRGRLPNHPVYVVKVDNTSSAAPQVGLEDADLVVEELVEGGLTRLAAFYYSKIPPVVGPVRSMRASDIGITQPANAFIVASGAAGKTLMLLNQAGVQRVTEGAVGFYRSSTRSAPYNLMMKLPALAAHVEREWHPPSGPYLPFGQPRKAAGSQRVHTIRASFSGAHSDEWRLQGHTWVRTNSYAETGHDFKVDNVLILRVQVGDAGYLDPAGNPVPETFFFGHGVATLVHGDTAVKGTWVKNGTRGAVRLRTASGAPMMVPAGHTFIELVPAQGGSLTLG
jgi:DUF3048 family protein